ncbi:MAG TPA: Gfo/Idh/MocA family oxidoreductase [Terrimesophilobacter sp.]|nr:Gfo/Idh/MocA family oxidoreductase [Terrimesophilobacter sp.]
MGSLRWGILGTGWIAHAQTADLLAHGFTVTAAGSRTRTGAAEFAAEFGIPNAHESYESLVADDSVDVIYVATPHPMHVSNSLLALDAGKHVLVEKPFALTAREARELVDLAARKHLVVLEAMWTRFLPHMVRLREIIRAGTIGEVHTLIADHNQLLSDDPEGRLRNPALGGGALLDLGIYPVSFAWDLFGEPSRVLASGTKTPTGVDRQTAIILEYPHDQRAVLHCALDTPGPNRAAVIGTTGRIELESVWYTPTSFTVFDSRGEPTERYRSDVTGRGMQYQAWELERLVADGPDAADLLPPEQSVKTMETLDEVRRQIGLTFPGEP